MAFLQKKLMSFREKLLYVVVNKIDYFRSDLDKTSSQVNFNTMISLRSNMRNHFQLNFVYIVACATSYAT